MAQKAEKVEDLSIPLGLLSRIDDDHQITQRALSNELGIALGMVNIYMKRCIRKGWVKVRQAPANRYLYYLTPMGFQEKSRLTTAYLTTSFNFFRSARRQMSQLFEACETNGYRTTVLYGAGDLAEIAILSSKEVVGVEIAFIVDARHADQKFLGLDVVGYEFDPTGIDVAIIADMEDSRGAAERAARIFGADRVLSPAMLRGPIPSLDLLEKTEGG